MATYKQTLDRLSILRSRAYYSDDIQRAYEIEGEIEELQAYREEVIRAGCDPDDPESHDWKRMGESHTPDGRTIWYQCQRCGAEDSS